MARYGQKFLNEKSLPKLQFEILHQLKINLQNNALPQIWKKMGGKVGGDRKPADSVVLEDVEGKGKRLCLLPLDLHAVRQLISYTAQKETTEDKSCCYMTSKGKHDARCHWKQARMPPKSGPEGGLMQLQDSQQSSCFCINTRPFVLVVGLCLISFRRLYSTGFGRLQILPSNPN